MDILFLREGEHLLETFLAPESGLLEAAERSAEECFEEMLAFTQEKNIHVKLKAPKA